MKLWLVRHARPLVAAGICYGHLDVLADARHTTDTVRALTQALSGTNLNALHCSPLQRTAVMGRVLAEQMRLPLHHDGRLAEMNFGRWEGVPWAEIPKKDIDAWTSDFAHHSFGGQESTQQVLERVWSALQHARQGTADQLWVTHAGVMRAVQHLLKAGAPVIQRADEWPAQAPGPGSWMTVEL